MSIVNEFLKDLNDYMNRLQEENTFLKRGYDELKRENERLKDNEKEMFKVSSIITTSNENTKLKNYINILEEQLQKYKSTSKVVFEDYDHQEQVKENVPIDNVLTQQCNEAESKTSNNEDFTIPIFIDDSVNSSNTEINVDFRVFKYKNETYIIDENNILYENNDNVKGKEVGKRRLNKKTNKLKTILY